MDYSCTIINAEVGDTLKGIKGSDTLTGLEGNTVIKGLSGDDYSWTEAKGGLVLEYLYNPIAYLENVNNLSTSDFIFL